MPPVSPRSAVLPFEGSAFTWSTFESFICDFLAAGPVLLGPDGNEVKIRNARPYGRKGDRQDGIDIIAETDAGETWAFQCKHYPKAKWGPKQTRDAIEACHFAAQRKFLLVTRELECVVQHPDWELWDSRKISREFSIRLLPATAARLLYVHFGPGWPEQFFDAPGSFSLMAGEAKYRQLLEEGRSFHHRLPMYGRTRLLQELHEFAESPKKRVLLLRGRAGIGKSRLLLAWASEFERSHPDHALRFLSDAPRSAADYGKELDLEGRPLVVVLDDAHRFPEIRNRIFPLVAERQGVNLVLVLRPGAGDAIQRELLEAGFDLTEIAQPKPIGPLRPGEALRLAEAALGDRLTTGLRGHFTWLAKDSPLFVVLAAELLKRGELAERDFRDTDEFRLRVLQLGFHQDLEELATEFNAGLLRKFAGVLAVLAPVKLEAPFYEAMAKFAGIGTSASDISHLAEAFEKAGLIVTTDAGARIVPDLLSDQLVYDACCDSRGRDRGFVKEVLECFQDERFATLVQNVASADWRAAQLGADGNLMEPAWHWFAERFRRSGFWQRSRQLQEWANIAHLQPERTIRLVKLALELRDQPGAPPDSFRTEALETPDRVIGALPDLLKIAAEISDRSVRHCLDLLWELGEAKAIGEIAGFRFEKAVAITAEALSWMEDRFTSPESFGGDSQSVSRIPALLGPVFRAEVEETGWLGRRMFFQTRRVSLTKTSAYRDRVLRLCERFIRWGDARFRLGVLDLLEGAAFTWFWREGAESEARGMLAVVRQFLGAEIQPVVLFRVRRFLRNRLGPQVLATLRSECEEMLREVPDTLEVRLCRATLSVGAEEFEEPEREASWREFLDEVANELIERFPAAEELRCYLSDWHDTVFPTGFHPNLRPLFHVIAERFPATAIELAQGLIETGDTVLGRNIGILVVPATSVDARIELLQSALASDVIELKEGAIDGFAYWRRETGSLPDTAWDQLLLVAGIPLLPLLRTFLYFGWLNQEHLVARDWELLARLPVEQFPEVAESYLERMECAIRSGSLPGGDLIDSMLQKLDRIESLDGHGIAYRFHQLAKSYPFEVFLLFWRRVQIAKRPIPLDLSRISFAAMSDDPRIDDILTAVECGISTECGLPWRASQLFSKLVVTCGEQLETRLIAMVERVSSPESLEHLAEAMNSPVLPESRFVPPPLAKALLVKAREHGMPTVQRIQRQLARVPGVRGRKSRKPDANWNLLLEAAERLAHRYAGDPDLGPLYAKIVKNERDWMRSRTDRDEEE